MSEPTSLAPALEPERSSALDRIIGVFIAPVETMRNIAAYPDWLIPMILMMVLSAAGAFASAPRIDAESEVRAAIESKMKGQNIPADVMEKQVEFGAKIARGGAQYGWIGWPLFVIIVAGAMLAAFSVFGGRATFRQALAIVTYSWIPLTVRGLIAAAVVAMRSDDTMPTAMLAASYTNLGFLADLEHSRALFMLLTALDLFTMFSLFLMIVGFESAARVSRRTSATIVLSLWLITVLLRVVPAMFQ